VPKVQPRIGIFHDFDVHMQALFTKHGITINQLLFGGIGNDTNGLGG